MTTTTYSMKNVTATIDTREVRGLWEGDDTIVIEENADIGTMTIGADGSSIFSVACNHAAVIRIKLQHGSPLHEFFVQRLALQRDRGGLGTGFSFTVNDRASGEGGAAEECFIQQAPSQEFGVNATMREWVLATGDYRRTT